MAIAMVCLAVWANVGMMSPGQALSNFNPQDPEAAVIDA